jgi:hypothetical protein
MRWKLVAVGTLWVGLISIHMGFANEYYRMERTRLQTIASTAACAGAQLLPANSNGARQAARGYAEISGISSSDVVLVEVGDDQRSLTVELGYKIPIAFALFHWNVGRYLTVTAHANLEPAIPAQLHEL